MKNCKHKSRGETYDIDHGCVTLMKNESGEIYNEDIDYHLETEPSSVFCLDCGNEIKQIWTEKELAEKLAGALKLAPDVVWQGRGDGFSFFLEQDNGKVMMITVNEMTQAEAGLEVEN